LAETFAATLNSDGLPAGRVAGDIRGAGRPLGFDQNTLTMLGMVAGDWFLLVNLTRCFVVEMSNAHGTGNTSVRWKRTRQIDGQITGALIASLWFCLAVFVPYGVFSRARNGGDLQQVSRSTIISAMELFGGVALTLTPALCAFAGLQAGQPTRRARVLFGLFEPRFLDKRGRVQTPAAVGWLVARPLRVGLVYLRSIALRWCSCSSGTPQGFLPAEDQGTLVQLWQARQGPTRSARFGHQNRSKTTIVENEDDVVASVFGVVGLQALGRPRANIGLVFVR